MSWLPILSLALVVALAFTLVLRVRRSNLTLVGSALLLGLAGYAWQGHPGMGGAPKLGGDGAQEDGRAMVEARRSFEQGRLGDKFLVVSDAFARQGNFANAAGFLLGVVRNNPKDGQAWLAMANALTAHADGNLTPASLYAYRMARAADPADPAPDFFLGVTMIRDGRLIEAHKLWRNALQLSPADAPWRADLEQRIATLEALMRRITAQ